MEQLQMAVESGDVKQLQEAIAAGQSALWHSSFYLPLSVSDNDRDGMKFNRRVLQRKITTAKKLFVSNLQKCKVYIKALRKAARSRNYKMVKQALQMAHTAPPPVQRYMWKDIQTTQELLDKLAKVRAQTRQILKSRKWQQIDHFLNEHAQLLDDRTILALVQTREDFIRAQRQINERHGHSQDVRTLSNKRAGQGDDTTRSNENMTRSPHLHSVRVPISAHHTASLHNKQNVKSYSRVNNDNDDNDDIVQNNSPRTRHPQALVKTYTLPFTQPQSHLPLHNNADDTNNQLLPVAKCKKVKNVQQKPQQQQQRRRRQKKQCQNNGQGEYRLTQKTNKYNNNNSNKKYIAHSKSKQNHNKIDYDVDIQYRDLQSANDNTNMTKSQLYNQEVFDRQNITKQEVHKRSIIYVDEMMQFAPPCLRKNVVLVCKQNSRQRKSGQDNINDVVSSQLKSAMYLDNIAMYKTLPVIRYSNTFDISPI